MSKPVRDWQTGPGVRCDVFQPSHERKITKTSKGNIKILHEETKGNFENLKMLAEHESLYEDDKGDNIVCAAIAGAEGDAENEMTHIPER